jgi:hypothetical protein
VRQFGECSEGGNARGGGSEIIFKNGRLKRIFPEFKWIIYDFINNRNSTQKIILTESTITYLNVHVKNIQNIRHTHFRHE